MWDCTGYSVCLSVTVTEMCIRDRVGTASPVMHKYIKYPLKWALINKLKSLQGKDICLEPNWWDGGQDSFQGDLREKF